MAEKTVEELLEEFPYLKDFRDRMIFVTEKEYNELSSSEKIFIGKPIELDKDFLYTKLDELKERVHNEDVDSIESLMKEIVTTYKKEIIVNV